MLLAGIAVDLGCFFEKSAKPAAHAPAFHDRFSLFSELEKVSFPPWSFTAELGLREAFAHPAVLSRAVAGFRNLLLTPRLVTTGVHFSGRAQAFTQLEALADAGVQRVILRLDEAQARSLPTECLHNLADACQSNGVELQLQFDLLDTFSEAFCRLARLVEDRQFTVTVLPFRIRPTRSLALDDAPHLAPKERLQLVLNASGQLLARRRTVDEVLDVMLGSADERPVHELIAAARRR
jgi:hypothetical protein